MGDPRRKRTVEELRLEVDRRALAQLEALLEPNDIEHVVKEIFQDRVESIVCSALGFERSDYGNGWKLKEHQRDGEVHAVHKLIAEHAEAIAKQMLPTLLEDVETHLKLKPLLTKTARAAAKEIFRECCYHELSAKLKEAIDEKADSAVATVLREKFEVRIAADLRTEGEKRGY
jgi:hypothetical protein